MHLILSKMNNRIRYLPCLTILCLLVACNSDSGKKVVKEKPAENPVIDVFMAKKGKLSASLQVPGELMPYQEVDLYAKENSFVKKVYVDVGSEVKQGDLLVSLEAPELSSKLSEAQSRLQSQEAIYTATRASYERLNETSKTPGTISPNELDQASAQKNAEFAQLQAARSVYNQVLDTRNYLQIRAPFSGVISERNINPGAYVGPSGKGSETPLFVLQQQKKLRLVVSVPEAFAGLLKVNHEVSFTVRSRPDEHFKAKVNRLAGALDNRLRSERVEMDVINEHNKLLPRMYAEVNLPMPASDSSWVVPKSAVVTSTEKIFVIKVTGRKAEWVEVNKGRESNGSIEIYGNIASGDQLIKNATDEIRNGSEVGETKVVE